jgi:peptide/nickel transport system ATP-binding protein/oligopeptide transport system ATP-binding protein
VLELENLIEVKGLKKYYSTGVFRHNYTKAVDGVSFSIRRGEIFGLVGESGCGKSTIARCLVRLIKPTAGQIYFEGEDLFSIKPNRLMQLRRKMQMIFQDADSSLNRRIRIRDLLAEPYKIHGLYKGEEEAAIQDLIKLVNLTPDLLSRFPHEISGGQRQRVGIARAIALNPDLIIADEPAASLDISMQAQIFELIKALQNDLNVGYLLISHNLRVVRLVANRIAVMYAGKIIEVGDTKDIIANPTHPYTQALFSCIFNYKEKKRIILKGESTRFDGFLSGCRFYPRCSQTLDICQHEEPGLKKIHANHSVACHRS